MSKVFLIAFACFFSLNSSGKEIPLSKYEEVVAFGNGMIGITIERQNSPTIYIRQIKPDLEEGKTISIYEGDGRRVADYSIMGSRLVITVVDFNVDKGDLDVYFYDTTLTLISQKSLKKQPFEKMRTRTGSTETRFDMLEYYNRQTTNYQYGLLSSDKFVDDGLLFLKFNECAMLKDPMEYTKNEMTDPDSPVVIYYLKWGQDTGVFPVNFDVKWSVKLPFKKVFGYHFYTYGKNTMFLYLASNDGGVMRSYYYKLNPETGEIIQKIEVKVKGAAVPWVSSSFYDEQSGKLFIVGNYEHQIRVKNIFDGYFVASVNDKGEIVSVLKPYPVLPKNDMPENWSKEPMLIACDFVKAKDGRFTTVCSFCYSLDEPERITIIGEPMEAGRVIVTAAVVLVDFDQMLSQVESRAFTFQHYVTNGWKSYYRNSTEFLLMNHMSISQEYLHPVFAGFSETGAAEFLCPNALEAIAIEDRNSTTSFYVISTDKNTELKKTFDFVSTRADEDPDFFRGLPGEVILNAENLKTIKIHT